MRISPLYLALVTCLDREGIKMGGILPINIVIYSIAIEMIDILENYSYRWNLERNIRYTNKKKIIAARKEQFC